MTKSISKEINQEVSSGLKPSQERFHKFYVGIDIGYKFHVAACIPLENFLDTKESWKKTKTIKFDSDSKGLHQVLDALNIVSKNPKDFFILMEPTGGHYGFTIMTLLLSLGYDLFQVENKAVKDFRERSLGIKEKSDQIDAKIMAYMGFHKAMHPSMISVRLVTPSTPTQILFHTLTRDRWLLSQQLTRRKNQVLQLFSVTNPELKSVFAKPSRTSVLKLVLSFPTAREMAAASEDEIKNVLLKAGAHRVANKYAKEIKELVNNSIAIEAPHLITRQNWLIEEAQNIQKALDDLDTQIHTLLFGNMVENTPPHPYTRILFSLPSMSDTWACALIGVIGDINRFDTYKRFKKYLGFSAENSKSGTSVDKTRLTYDGVRDTRRVLFQMALVLISPKIGKNVFKEYYNKLISGRPSKCLPPMPKMKALGHICGKLSQVIYGCLKANTLYNPRIHAKACGIEWDDSFICKYSCEDGDEYLIEAQSLANLDGVVDDENGL